MGRKALSSSEASARLRMLVYCLRILHTLRRVLECFEIGTGEAMTLFFRPRFRFPFCFRSLMRDSFQQNLTHEFASMGQREHR